MAVLSFYEIFYDYECEQFERLQNEHNEMMRLYPSCTGRLLTKIQKLCDRLEYEGSPMLHAYPDAVWLEAQVSLLYRSLSASEGKPPEGEVFFLSNRPCSHPLSYPAPLAAQDANACPDTLKTLITILLLNEISYRRFCYFRQKRYHTFYDAQ